MDQNENAFISYSCELSKTLENASKWKRWRHMYHVGCKISQERVFVACTWTSTCITTCHSMPFSVDNRKRIKTVVWTRIDRRVFDDNENALVWTGPWVNSPSRDSWGHSLNSLWIRLSGSNYTIISFAGWRGVFAESFYFHYRLDVLN